MPHIYPKRIAILLCSVASVLLLLHIIAQSSNPPSSPVVHRSGVVFKKDPGFYERSAKVYLPQKVLLPYADTAGDTINYIWCGDKVFQFKHFLSFLSVFKIQQPNKVIVHWYKDHPLLKDKNDYNLWYWQLTENFYNILMIQRPNSMPDCYNEDQMMAEIVDVLRDRGGIYMNESTIINKDLHSLRWDNVTVALFDKSKSVSSSNLAYIVAKKPFVSEDYIRNARQITCSFPTGVDVAEYPNCVFIEKTLYPKDIMEAPGVWNAFIRYIYYGSPDMRYSLWSMDDPIPNIGHMVLLGGNELNFLSYLSIRSMIHCVGVDAMYIYIDQEPTGEWYNKLKLEEAKAVFVYHEWPGSVFGKSIRDGSHSSDLMRFDLLYRYGGIYVDWDAVMLKPLGDLRGYGFVTDFDWPDWHPPYPDVINNGVSAGKKGSVFLKRCLQLFKKYDPNGDWYYNGLMMPYKVYEQYPEEVKIERKLQVICFNLKCHPVWLPGYHDENIHHLNGASFDWKEVYAFHWTRPSPPELMDPAVLKTSTSMFAEIGRYILSCKGNNTFQSSNFEPQIRNCFDEIIDLC